MNEVHGESTQKYQRPDAQYTQPLCVEASPLSSPSALHLPISAGKQNRADNKIDTVHNNHDKKSGHLLYTEKSQGHKALINIWFCRECLKSLH